jgi:membrane-bound ClpP family serine protease
MKIIRLISACFTLGLFLTQPVHAVQTVPTALVLTIDGAITPAVQDTSRAEFILLNRTESSW